MNIHDYQNKLGKLVDLVKKKLENAPGCHDIDHTLRVRHNAMHLAKLEPKSNKQVVETAALLHDIARPEEMATNGKVCHAENGAELALDILEKCEFHNDSFINAVTNCIKRHRFRKGEAPESIEEKIVYDADKLDSIGAIGIGRAFHFAGRIGARVHNTEKEATDASSYSKEDSAYREYLVKLRHIQEKVLTESGRKIAEERTAFMHNFFDRLNQEVYSKKSN